jgi:Flp pilus assembly protein TadD
MTTEAQRAIELEPRFAFGYIILSLAQLQSGDAQHALESSDQALKLSQSRFLMSLAAYVYAKAGRPTEAAQLAHRLEALSQHEFVCFFNIASVYAALGDREKAFASLERGYNDHTG